MICPICEEYLNNAENLKNHLDSEHKDVLNGKKVPLVSEDKSADYFPVTVCSHQHHWSACRESQFLSKVDCWAEIDHPNVAILLGYGEQSEPFTRKMLFEGFEENQRLDAKLNDTDGYFSWWERIMALTGVAEGIIALDKGNCGLRHLSTQNVFLDQSVSKVVAVESCRTLLDPPLPVIDIIRSFGDVVVEVVNGQPLTEIDATLQLPLDPTLGADYDVDQLETLTDVVMTIRDGDDISSVLELRDRLKRM